MATFDALVGVAETTLNAFLRSVHSSAHADLLTGSLPVKSPELGLEEVDFDVVSAPALDLPAEPDGDVQLTIDRLAVTVHYLNSQSATGIEGAVRARVEFEVRGDVITPRLLDLRVHIPGEAALEDFVNKGLAPYLTQAINDTFLKPLSVPPLRIKGLELSPPAIAIGSNRFLAASAVAPDPSAAGALDGGWPAETAFLGVDARLLNIAADRMLEGKEFSGNWSHTIKFGLGQSTLKVDYSGTLREIDLALVDGADPRLRGKAVLGIALRIYAKHIGSASGTAIARPTVRATVLALENNEIAVRLDRLEDIDFDISSHGATKLLAETLEAYAELLAKAMSSTINEALTEMRPLTVVEIPALPFTVRNTLITVVFGGLKLSTLRTPQDLLLLTATGTAEVTTRHA